MINWFVVDAMDAFDAMVLLPGNLLQNENEMAAKVTNGDESQWIMYCEMYLFILACLIDDLLICGRCHGCLWRHGLDTGDLRNENKMAGGEATNGDIFSFYLSSGPIVRSLRWVYDKLKNLAAIS